MGAAALPVAVGAQVAGGAFSAYSQGQAGKAQSDYYGYLAANAARNASLARASITANRQEIGAQEADQQRRLSEGISKTVGAQKAAIAANGVGLSSRTAQDIVRDTLTRGNLDEMALRHNADLKAKNAEIGGETAALGYEEQGRGYGIAGRNAIDQSRIQQVSTILGTAGSVASDWYKFGGGGGGGRTPGRRYDLDASNTDYTRTV